MKVLQPENRVKLRAMGLGILETIGIFIKSRDNVLNLLLKWTKMRNHLQRLQCISLVKII
jgi:hypothetical protein